VKSHNLIAGICLALLIVISEGFLVSANRQKSVALAQLRDAQQQVADLQSQLAQATNSASTDDAFELARLRADNQDVPRLRNQVLQLQAENKKLLMQLGAAQEAAKQGQDQLQEIQSENEQAAAQQQAAEDQQAEVAERIAAQQRNECIANLRLIYAAKQAWALEKNKTDSDTPTEQDLLPYIKGGVFPACPSGGTYTIGSVGQVPTCSTSGHVLPPQ
jgi:chromosome segregation ATPase